MNIKMTMVGLLVCGLAACGGESEDASTAEGAVQTHTLAQAQKAVKDFYGEEGPRWRPEGGYPELTAEANEKIRQYLSTLPEATDFFVNPFTGTGGLAPRLVSVGKPNYVFGEKEAVMTITVSELLEGIAPGHLDQLVTVRVRMADLKISEVTAAEECGGDFELVGQYDMRTTYPAAAGGAGRVEVYWSNLTRENCVIARCVERCDEKIRRSVSLRADGGEWVTDAGQFSLYAGPVKVKAPSTCIDVKASFGEDGDLGQVRFDNKHCN
jgi:hypothetical protein